MSNSKGSQFLRSNVLGLVAIFIAATGTAVVAEAQNATTAKVTDAKFKKLKKRVAALEGRVNAPVTGDLTGTLPNLQLAQNSVTTNEIAANAVTTVKIADNAVATAKDRRQRGRHGEDRRRGGEHGEDRRRRDHRSEAGWSARGSKHHH